MGNLNGEFKGNLNGEFLRFRMGFKILEFRMISDLRFRTLNGSK